MAWSLHRRFRSSKVPDVDLTFWVLKILSTAMGESTSDYFVHRFAPVPVVLAGAVVFAVAIANQLRAPRYLPGAYWTAVVMVSVFGTMCADVVHVGFGVPYVVSSVTFALALIAVFTWWYRIERTLSIHSIQTMPRELFYWASVTVTFALGTAVGDMTAYTLGLGFLAAGLVFGVLFALSGLGYRYLGLNAVGSFWTAYVLTRPLGASLADWIGVSPTRGGLDAGPGTVGLSLTALIAALVLVLMRKARGQRLLRRY